MNKKRVERTLLKVFKEQKFETFQDFFDLVTDIINGNYDYENEEIKMIEHDEILKSLEKVLIIGSDFKTNDSSECLTCFYENIDKLKYNDLSKNNGKYFLYNLQSKISKSKGVVTSLAIILSFLMVASYLKQEEKPIIVEEPIIEEEIETETFKSPVINKRFYNLENDYYNKLIENEPFFKILDKYELTLNEKLVFLSQKNDIPQNQKKEIILEKYNLTMEEFDILCAIVLGESAPNSYEDAYAVINTIYNRTHSKRFCNMVDNVYDGKGNNLYYQAICPGQFVVYENEIYKEKLGIVNEPGYDAILDFLVMEIKLHDFLSFKSNKTEVKNGVRFVSDGNNYNNPLLEEDRINEFRYKI